MRNLKFFTSLEVTVLNGHSQLLSLIDSVISNTKREKQFN